MKFEFVLLKKNGAITKRGKILAGVSLLIILPATVKLLLMLGFMALNNYEGAVSMLPVMLHMQFLDLNVSYPGLAAGLSNLYSSMPIYRAGEVDIVSKVLQYAYPVTRIALLVLAVGVIRESKRCFTAFVITLAAIITLAFLDLLFLIFPGGDALHSFAPVAIKIVQISFLSAILYFLNAEQLEDRATVRGWGE